ncbi:MAG TPA: hypothetical protein VHI13_01835 [Candidatus Kapabacteria bacterium]|nr:hypothetical protein [Candidatus Kapabacteria bacterium]
MPIALAEMIDRLQTQYGTPSLPPAETPFELVLWEQAAYLSDDAARRGTFLRLRSEIGTDPEAIAHVSPHLLADLLRGGGIHTEERAERMQASARIVLDSYGGDMRALLALPLAVARKKLATFPMIGEPGAEKILMMTRTHPSLAPESNGLRVLLRVGYGAEQKNYSASYRSVRDAVAPQIPAADYDWLAGAHLLLREHGQTLCKRTRPACGSCPLAPECTHANGED